MRCLVALTLVCSIEALQGVPSSAKCRRVVVDSTVSEAVDVVAPLVAFSASHVGLSNVREPIIDALGRCVERLGLVGSGLALPKALFATTRSDEPTWWPSRDVAGRQLYRALYTLIAFWTLGESVSAYARYQTLGSGAPHDLITHSAPGAAAFCLAVVAQSISLASLANPSPLSLVPGVAAAPDGFARDDTVKLRAYGLTRLTRHPLILPVLPWGLGNAVLAGGDSLDWLLFGGLGAYAVVGCWAQDARAQRNAQVGTVFADGQLADFYESTSFAPFGAVADGRQSVSAAVAELGRAWPVLALSLAGGFALEWAEAGLL